MVKLRIFAITKEGWWNARDKYTCRLWLCVCSSTTHVQLADYVSCCSALGPPLPPRHSCTYTWISEIWVRREGERLSNGSKRIWSQKEALNQCFGHCEVLNSVSVIHSINIGWALALFKKQCWVMIFKWHPKGRLSHCFHSFLQHLVSISFSHIPIAGRSWAASHGLCHKLMGFVTALFQIVYRWYLCLLLSWWPHLAWGRLLDVRLPGK